MKHALALALVILAMLPGCDNPTSSDGAQVEFVRWRTFGHSGASGYVKNNGNKMARDCRVKTKGGNGGTYLTSSTSPRDIDPGETASFSGAACGQRTPGLLSRPGIVWIKWD